MENLNYLIYCNIVAFGLGINKSNIRVVVIADTPENVSNYAQMVGRAGRDGRHAEALCLYQPGDFGKKIL